MGAYTTHSRSHLLQPHAGRYAFQRHGLGMNPTRTVKAPVRRGWWAFFAGWARLELIPHYTQPGRRWRVFTVAGDALIYTGFTARGEWTLDDYTNHGGWNLITVEQAAHVLRRQIAWSRAYASVTGTATWNGECQAVVPGDDPRGARWRRAMDAPQVFIPARVRPR